MNKYKITWSDGKSFTYQGRYVQHVVSCLLDSQDDYIVSVERIKSNAAEDALKEAGPTDYDIVIDTVTRVAKRGNKINAIKLLRALARNSSGDTLGPRASKAIVDILIL